MKLTTFLHQPTASVRWGFLLEDGFYPLDKNEDGSHTPYPTLIAAIEGGEAGEHFLKESFSRLQDGTYQGSLIPLQECRFLPPYRPTKNVICVGKNYADHALEMTGGDKSAIPEHPVFFTKSPTSVIGHLEEVDAHQEFTQALDYEGELLVIIGKEGKDIPVEEALDYVFGYSILNDVTARDIQKRHLQFFKGKSLDTFSPVGPYIIPREFIVDPQNLSVQTYVNEELRQNGHTSDMIFSVSYLIHILSQGMKLEPGDMLATGTPSGVGQGFTPPRYLKSGDKVSIKVEGIGELCNTIR